MVSPETVVFSSAGGSGGRPLAVGGLGVPMPAPATRAGTETETGTGTAQPGTRAVTAVPSDADGPLAVCPVLGRGYYVANFGAYRAGPPVHPHQGNDIFAPYGTPIVAPFDGRAVATPNKLGGKAVKVYGELGYVYNAHLSKYGQLGEVEVGDVIGFVGTSGNAQASVPHDHFEWHPADGRAIDPFGVLNEACPPA